VVRRGADYGWFVIDGRWLVGSTTASIGGSRYQTRGLGGQAGVAAWNSGEETGRGDSIINVLVSQCKLPGWGGDLPE
jgi:hypothetical protein